MVVPHKPPTLVPTMRSAVPPVTTLDPTIIVCVVKPVMLAKVAFVKLVLQERTARVVRKLVPLVLQGRTSPIQRNLLAPTVRQVIGVQRPKPRLVRPVITARVALPLVQRVPQVVTRTKQDNLPVFVVLRERTKTQRHKPVVKIVPIRT